MVPPNTITKFFAIISTYLSLLEICSPILSASMNTSECLYPREIKNRPYLQFPIQSNLTCWEYCKYLDSCTAFSFSLGISSLCRFYTGYERNLIFKHDPDRILLKETIYSGVKRCMLLNELQSMFRDGTGGRRDALLIKQVGTGSCLDVSSVPAKWGDVRLVWVQDCRAATQWHVEQLNVTNVGTLVRITDKESGNCMTAMSGMNHGLMNFPAVMRECANKDEETQTFLLIPVAHAATKLVPESVSFKILTLFPEINVNIVTDIILMGAARPCDKLQVAHGRLLQHASQPLHVPGESIVVICDPGYGVKMKGGYSQYFTAMCSNSLTVPQCVETTLIGGESGGESVLEMSYLVVAIVIAVMLFLSFVLCVQCRKIQSLHRSDDPGPEVVVNRLTDVEIGGQSSVTTN